MDPIRFVTDHMIYRFDRELSFPDQDSYNATQSIFLKSYLRNTQDFFLIKKYGKKQNTSDMKIKILVPLMPLSNSFKKWIHTLFKAIIFVNAFTLSQKKVISSEEKHCSSTD